jgi:predicted enzyme related to lactoylglutathione lyase
MHNAKMRLVGVELYFQDLDRAKGFYHGTLGLDLAEETAGHHAKFDGGAAFICLERTGAESYPSHDKAVVFLEAPDLRAAVQRIGPERFVAFGPEDGTGQLLWAVLHDPEGHNVLLLQAQQRPG